MRTITLVLNTSSAILCLICYYWIFRFITYKEQHNIDIISTSALLSKYRSTTILNDILLPGPNLIYSLLVVLIRLWEEPVAADFWGFSDLANVLLFLCLQKKGIYYISRVIETTTIWWITFAFFHLADSFVQSHVQMRSNPSHSMSRKSLQK